MVGIYKIQNAINGKCYIGQSRNIKHRWQAHKHTHSNPKAANYNAPLYCAMRKYGIDNFQFDVLQECTVAELNHLEQVYIKAYDSFWNGYNCSFGGDSSAIQTLDKPQLKGILSDLENTDLLHREIATKWGVSTETVQGINTGRYWRQDRTYPIQTRYKRSVHPEHRVGMINKHDIVKHCIDCGARIWYTSTRCPLCEKKRRQQNSTSRCPDKPTLLSQLQQLQNFSAVAKIYGVSDNAVRKWCRQLGIPDKTSAYKPSKPTKPKVCTIQIRPVNMIDIETDAILHTFPSVSAAEQHLRGKETGAIIHALKSTNPTAYGYKWVYADENT